MGGLFCGGSVTVSIEFIDNLRIAANSAGDLARAIECTRMAVCSELSDPEMYIEGTLNVLLLSAEHVRASTVTLCEEAERILEDRRTEALGHPK